MNKNYSVKLIEGAFSKQRTQSIITDLINYKINLHEMEKFSNEERFGNDIDFSAKRISELLIEKQNLIEWLNTLNENESLGVRCQILLTKK